MLKPPEHQVAGHKAGDGRLGPLIDGEGLFFKPLQSDARGTNELTFYTNFSSNPHIPARIRSFFPVFHGTQLIPSSVNSVSSPHPHIILDDLFHNLRHPSVIDIKIGSRTWLPSSPDDYFQKCLLKDRKSTSARLGFRISGLKINFDGRSWWRPTHDEVRRLDGKDVGSVLRRFVSSDLGADCELDCAFAAAVYGGPEGVLAQLRELKVWFEEQTVFHFCSASVLVGYGRGGGARVRVVDFAHVVEGDGVIDHNFLGGLCSLIKFIEDIVNDPAGREL